VIMFVHFDVGSPLFSSYLCRCIINKRLAVCFAIQNVFSDVFFIICRNNFSACARIISGEGYVNSSEKPNDGNERKVLCLLEKEEVLNILDSV
jgi:hypothetical protein